VVTPGARRLRFSHSVVRDAAVALIAGQGLAMAAAVSRIRSKQSKTCWSPSMCRLVMSQLLVPELRGSPV
jgi:hypothetical protein